MPKEKKDAKQEVKKGKEPYTKPALKKYDKLHKIGIGD